MPRRWAFLVGMMVLTARISTGQSVVDTARCARSGEVSHDRPLAPGAASALRRAGTGSLSRADSLAAANAFGRYLGTTFEGDAAGWRTRCPTLMMYATADMSYEAALTAFMAVRGDSVRPAVITKQPPIDTTVAPPWAVLIMRDFVVISRDSVIVWGGASWCKIADGRPSSFTYFMNSSPILVVRSATPGVWQAVGRLTTVFGDGDCR
jgi:hypothetical protein